MSDLEAFARHYWAHAGRLRMTLRQNSADAEAEDELSVLLCHTDNRVIRGDVQRLLGQMVARTA